MLATAIVEIQNKSVQYIPCRALLGSASQSHFIPQRCLQRLRLSRTQTNAFITGISNVNTATRHSVSIQLRSRHTDWHTIDCAILSNITGNTPSTKLDTSTWKIPKDIKLADEQFNQPGGIDLLIGTDLFYEILRSGWRTRPGNYPVLQETVLGWTFSERTPDTLPQLRMNHIVNSCFKTTTVQSTIQTASGKCNPWSNPLCQRGNQPVTNSSKHIQLNTKMEDVLNHHRRRITSILYFFTPLQSEG